jgi:hypothetical protein
LVCPGLPESDRVGSSSVTKCLETRHFVRFSGHVVTLLDPPFSEFDSRRLHHGTAENRGPVALRGAWQARDKARRGEDEPRITTRERPPPRDTTDPIIPAGSPVSATALARNVDGADLPLPNVLSAKHLDRIAGGLLYAATSRARRGRRCSPAPSKSTARPAPVAPADSRCAPSSPTSRSRAGFSTRCREPHALRRSSTRPSPTNPCSRDATARRGLPPPFARRLPTIFAPPARRKPINTHDRASARPPTIPHQLPIPTRCSRSRSRCLLLDASAARGRLPGPTRRRRSPLRRHRARRSHRSARPALHHRTY